MGEVGRGVKGGDCEKGRGGVSAYVFVGSKKGHRMSFCAADPISDFVFCVCHF
jgi:hypothetical protein